MFSFVVYGLLHQAMVPSIVHIIYVMIMEQGPHGNGSNATEPREPIQRQEKLNRNLSPVVVHIVLGASPIQQCGGGLAQRALSGLVNFTHNIYRYYFEMWRSPPQDAAKNKYWRRRGKYSSRRREGPRPVDELRQDESSITTRILRGGIALIDSRQALLMLACRGRWATYSVLLPIPKPSS